MQKIVITEDGDISTIQQFDSNGNLVDTCSVKKGSKIVQGNKPKTGKYSFEVAGVNTSGKNIENQNVTSSIDSESSAVTPNIFTSSYAPTLGYSYLGIKEFTSSGFPYNKYMKTSVNVSYMGNTTYSLRSWTGTVASFVAGVVVGLGVSAIIAGLIVGSLVGSALGVIVGDMLSISTSITLSCSKYSHDFTSRDADRPFSYKEGKWLGYQYVVNDISHPNLINNSYSDGYATQDYNNNSPQLLKNLFFNVYSCDGNPV